MNWLDIAKELQALGHTGANFTESHYDKERYERIIELSIEIFEQHSQMERPEIQKMHADDLEYITPKVDVRALIFEKDKVLLISEDADDGRWTVPGGWADVNASPSENVIREVKEESGFDCEVVRLLGALDRDKQGHAKPHPYHVYKLFYQCKIMGGVHTPNFESSKMGWFPVCQLPELSEARILPQQIRRFFELVNSDDPTVLFD